MENLNDKAVAGVDVDSKWLVVCITTRKKEQRFKNSATGVRRLLRYLQQHQVSLVVCERTGGYEKLLLEALWNAEIALHCAHPKAVREFGRALGRLAKTDPIDSAILAEYGLRMELPPTPRPPAHIIELRHMVARYNDLNAALIQEKNRLGTPGIPTWMKRNIRSSIRFISANKEKIKKQMEQHIQQHEDLAAAAACLRTQKGIGLTTSCTLLAELPELGTLNRQSAPALVGVAPINRDSGKWKGQRRIYGGRTPVRCAIYMATLSVIRERGVLRSTYLRLLSRGKKKMVALVAVMRKLVIRLNSLMRDFLQTRHHTVLIAA